MGKARRSPEMTKIDVLGHPRAGRVPGPDASLRTMFICITLLIKLNPRPAIIACFGRVALPLPSSPRVARPSSACLYYIQAARGIGCTGNPLDVTTSLGVEAGTRREHTPFPHTHAQTQ